MIDLLTLIIFLVGMTVVVALSLTGKIHIALLFLIPLFPLQNIIERFHQFPFGKDFIDIILITMVVGWVLRCIFNKEKVFVSTPFNKLLFIMIIFTYISLWRGSFYLEFPAPLSAIDIRVQTWKNYMIFPLLYFIIVNNVKTLKQIKWIIMVIVLSIFIMDYYTGNQIRWMLDLTSRNKLNGTFVWLGPNEVAAFYSQYIFILLGLFIMYKQKFYKIIFGTSVIVGLYIILFLYSRGAYVAVIAGFLAISLMRKKIILIIPLLILLIFWQTILPTTVIERINQTQTEEGVLDAPSQYRLDLWQEGLDIFKKSPVMGIGFNTIAFVGLIRGFKDTHNIYIKILAEQGIIGLIIFLLLFWLALKSGWRLYKMADDNFLKGIGLGFTACVIVTMTTNFFGDRWTYLQLGAYFWVFLGLVVRGNLIVSQGIENSHAIV